MSAGDIFIIILEYIITFFVIWGLNWIVIRFLCKKLNAMTSAIFAFVIVGFIVFMIAPYVITLIYPGYIYLPILIFWLIVNIIRANKEML